MRYWVFPLFSAFLFASFTSALVVGSVKIAPHDVFLYLTGFKRDSSLLSVVVDIRLIRTFAALLTGFSLGIAGALLQSLFRNPLADPFVLGVSSGSSLAIAATLVLGIGLGHMTAYDPYALYFAAAAGAVATSFLVIGLSSLTRTIVGLVLAGVMIGYLNAGLTTLIVTTSDVEIMRAFSFWTLGSFSAAKWSVLEKVLPFLSVGFVVSLFAAKPLNALAFGDDAASSMGVWVKGARVMSVAAASAVVAAATVVSGPVGFIGLASPHLARYLSNTSDNRVIIPLAGLAGATIGIVADIAARNIMPPLDLPITAITSIFGAPLIILLLVRGGKLT
ncbi:MAG: iron ABC transporter permease [Candidatus Caldarchaeum sp.]|nr:iron ABC transporter permease [Candidatus Caldarchaeum sp.]MCX8201769.1 iron ABC transporter permease [Candidatus Caldarchaeum sp.]MDW8435852.1 iron ABC transporter permease [Candidatus Caldarchaeum sp.]